MRSTKIVFAALFVLSCCGAVWGQAAKTDQPQTVTQVLDHSVSNVEHEFVSAADAMPEDKYSFAPTNGEFKGVRTFAQQVKHVAATNYMVASGILGEKPPVEIGSENGPDLIKSKADIMKFLKDSFAYAHKAVTSVDEKNLVAPIKDPFGEQPSVTRLALASDFAWHSFDHYGQMVEYLRMNGIIPPATGSKGSAMRCSGVRSWVNLPAADFSRPLVRNLGGDKLRTQASIVEMSMYFRNDSVDVAVAVEENQHRGSRSA